ncbi:VOC family protein [Streptacidiphilus sp. ASG 303]|uniref:VOC family protein n=1 Tax=Streptacidiphilus sp. ASG 303 TaxID=2896847 RepID=UPI001E5ED18D|nr:VOC family protein [Streptacidiphilus sp. ASG 303]MCD0482555.1 VOC family protein [Streptacidiphilus sp. ASG 303]
MAEQAWRSMPGTPCWVSLMARSLDAAQEFYGSLLGWEFRAAPSARLGPYLEAVVGHMPVAGIGAMAQNLGFPVSWTVFFEAEDADARAQAVRESGGTVAVGPLGFQDGRAALAADPAGAVFGIWQGDKTPGWRMRRSRGVPAWIELQTRDAFAAAVFYGEVFGWGSDPEGRSDVAWEHDRVVLRVDGHPVAGLCGGAVEAAPDPRVRPRWDVFFAVPDVDAAARAAAALGGEVAGPPTDTPYGRVAALRDREGGLFRVADLRAPNGREGTACLPVA